VKNITDINFNTREQNLFKKGLKYNIHQKPKKWIQNLALEAENKSQNYPIPNKPPLDTWSLTTLNNCTPNKTTPEINPPGPQPTI
jgi:hypothetical protein